MKTDHTEVQVSILRLTFAVCFAPVMISAASAQTSGSTLTANPVYQSNCAKCHAKAADGHFYGGPSLISDKATAMSSDDLRNIITNGKGRMPKYTGKLAPEEIDALVQQIKSGKPKP